GRMPPSNTFVFVRRTNRRKKTRQRFGQTPSFEQRNMYKDSTNRGKCQCTAPQQSAKIQVLCRGLFGQFAAGGRAPRRPGPAKKKRPAASFKGVSVPFREAAGRFAPPHCQGGDFINLQRRAGQSAGSPG